MEFEWDVLTIDTAEQLRDELLLYLQKEDTLVVLDLFAVNKIDLSAIQLFLSLKKSLEAQNRQLVLKNCTNSVIKAFELCGCAGLLECQDE